MGHEDPFLPLRLSARSVIRKQTVRHDPRQWVRRGVSGHSADGNQAVALAEPTRACAAANRFEKNQKKHRTAAGRCEHRAAGFEVTATAQL
jgi:hypothetical protein